jgi:primase-polymerase (primpol)-like protein
LGFVLTAALCLVVIDLDNAGTMVTGHIEMWARQILDDLNTYAEWSPGGHGIHIWAYGTLPPEGRVGHLDGHKIEVYNTERFLTITGLAVLRPLHEH